MIDIDSLDKVNQLQDLIGVIDLEYFRDFYFSHNEEHIDELSLYDVVMIKHHFVANNCTASLYIGCCYLDDGVYHVFLNFDNFEVFSAAPVELFYNKTKNIQNLLNIHEITVDHGYYRNLNSIAHKILKNIDDDYMDYNQYLNSLKQISENYENKQVE